MKVLFLLNDWQTLLSGRYHGYQTPKAKYLAHEFAKRGIEVAFWNHGPVFPDIDDAFTHAYRSDIPSADHCVVFQNNCFLTRTYDRETLCHNDPASQEIIGVCPLLDAVRRSVSGCVGVMRETAWKCGLEDTVFVEKPGGPMPPKAVYVGCAADKNMLEPKQEPPPPFRVLIDHPQYAGPKVRPDNDTCLLISSILRSNQPIEMRILERETIGSVGDQSLVFNNHYCSRVPHAVLCEEHRRSHVFCLTHRETLGLSVVEAAMAGNLIVARKGYLRKEIAGDLCTCEYEDAPNWDLITANVDPPKARQAALYYHRYEEMADIMFTHFREWTDT